MVLEAEPVPLNAMTHVWLLDPCDGWSGLSRLKPIVESEIKGWAGTRVGFLTGQDLSIFKAYYHALFIINILMSSIFITPLFLNIRPIEVIWLDKKFYELIR